MGKIGNVPEFTNDEGVSASEESSEQEVETTPGEETPTEAATANEPSEEEEKELPADDENDEKGKLESELAGLRSERSRLIGDLKNLRGERREIKQREIEAVDDKIEQAADDLKDVHDDDVKLIERVIRAKGYVSQSEIGKMLFKAKKEEVISKFLHDFPEYKPENDPENKKWGTLLQEVSLYREPGDVDQFDALLRRAHRLSSIASSSEPTIAVKKHQAEVAGAGSGGTRRSAPTNRLSGMLEQHMQGYTPEEIAEMQKRLSKR